MHREFSNFIIKALQLRLLLLLHNRVIINKLARSLLDSKSALSSLGLFFLLLQLLYYFLGGCCLFYLLYGKLLPLLNTLLPVSELFLRQFLWLLLGFGFYVRILHLWSRFG